MIGVYIVGEDDVTRHVIYRILSYWQQQQVHRQAY